MKRKSSSKQILARASATEEGDQMTERKKPNAGMVGRGPCVSKEDQRGQKPEETGINRPELREAHARARLAWADHWAEQVLAISLDGSGDVFIDNATGKHVIDHAKVQRDRLKADSIKWLVGKYAPRTYGERSVPVDEQPSQIKITWVHTGVPRADTPQADTTPPKQIAYHKPELPADLSEEAWAHVVQITELIKKIAPGDVAPEYVFGLIEDWLRQHFVSATDAKSARHQMISIT